MEGTREGLDAARALLTRPGESVSSIARLNNISRSTLYEDVSEAKGGPAPFRCLPAPMSGDRDQVKGPS